MLHRYWYQQIRTRADAHPAHGKSARRRMSLGLPYRQKKKPLPQQPLSSSSGVSIAPQMPELVPKGVSSSSATELSHRL